MRTSNRPTGNKDKWQFSAGATRSPLEVRVDPDLLLAGRVIKQATYEKDGKTERLPFRVKDGKISIRPADVPPKMRKEIPERFSKVSR